MTYAIEKGIPIPDITTREAKYPFRDMGVGDSFLAPKHQAGTIRAAAAYYRRRHHLKFLIKHVESDQVRVWRTE